MQKMTRSELMRWPGSRVKPGPYPESMVSANASGWPAGVMSTRPSDTLFSR